MDAFAHMRIRKARVRIREEGMGLKIEVVGEMINETITIEIAELSRIDLKPKCFTDRSADESPPAHVQPPERPTAVPQAPPPPQGIVGLTARRGYGIGKRHGTD